MKNDLWKLHRDRGLGGLGASGAPEVLAYLKITSMELINILISNTEIVLTILNFYLNFKWRYNH